MSKTNCLLEKITDEIYLNKIDFEKFKKLKIYEDLKNVKQIFEIYDKLLKTSIFNEIIDKKSPFIIYANHDEKGTGLTEIAKRYISILRNKYNNVFDFSFTIFNVNYTAKKLSLLLQNLKEFNQNVIFIYHGVCCEGLKEIIQFLNKNNVETFGYLTWETTLLPSACIDIYKEFQKIIVPSSFNKITFKKHFDNVTVLPHYWENTENSFNESMNNSMNSTSELFFYMINNSDDIRKNFINTFLWTVNWIINFKNNCDHVNNKINVKFIVKGSKGTVIDEIGEFVDKNNLNFVKVIKEFITREEIINIHVKSHIFVSLTHGEGVGMTIIDAIKYGSVVVAPKFSGYVDYIGYNYPYYVNTHLSEIKEIHLRINRCTNFCKIRNTYDKILFSNQEILEKQELYTH